MLKLLMFTLLGAPVLVVQGGTTNSRETLRRATVGKVLCGFGLVMLILGNSAGALPPASSEAERYGRIAGRLLPLALIAVGVWLWRWRTSIGKSQL